LRQFESPDSNNKLGEGLCSFSSSSFNYFVVFFFIIDDVPSTMKTVVH